MSTNKFTISNVSPDLVNWAFKVKEQDELKNKERQSQFNNTMRTGAKIPFILGLSKYGQTEVPQTQATSGISTDSLYKDMNYNPYVNTSLSKRNFTEDELEEMYKLKMLGLGG